MHNFIRFHALDAEIQLPQILKKKKKNGQDFPPCTHTELITPKMHHCYFE